jgi:hypothetical protein
VCDVRHISWQSVLVLHNCNSGHFIGHRMAVKLDSVDGFVDNPCIVWVLFEFIFVFQSVAYVLSAC